MIRCKGALVRCKVKGLGGKKVEVSPPSFSVVRFPSRIVQRGRVTVEAERHWRDVRARAR